MESPRNDLAGAGRSSRLLSGLFLAWVLVVAVRGFAEVAACPAPPPLPWQTHLIDLNRAPTTELALLPGVGPERAAAIVLHRVRFGRFRSGDDLLRIDGFGALTLERLRPFLAPFETSSRGGPR